MKKYSIYALLLLPFLTIQAQQVPAKKQEKSILIQNGIAHLGNGQVIQNALIGFKEGKLTLVADATLVKMDRSSYENVIDAQGKHIYPGFITPNSTLGLVEIDAVKASNDESEIGGFTPNVRSVIAYNSESKVVETARLNGVLIAQIVPRGGRISGTSSVVQLDAWNWQEAIIKEDEGIHLNFPSTFKKSGWWAEPGTIEANKDYLKQVDEIRAFLSKASAYNQEDPKEIDLVFKSTKGLFQGTQTLFINADEEKQIIDAVQLSKEFDIKKVVIVGGYQAYKVTDLLKKNNIAVLVNKTHNLPTLDNDDIDLPYKLPKLLVDAGITVGIENSGDKERMNTRNLPFNAGTAVAYGLTKEQALQTITLNSAKILGIDSFCGSLEVGKDATLFISEGDALDMSTNQLTKAFIQGREIILESHQTKLYKKYKERYNQ
ncbi:MAG: amidohydrolase family protein [Limnohabitans sp.]|nr:amidohydrolase family protein [Limnohabitans sp.]